MLNQHSFEVTHNDEWEQLELMLDALESARFWRRRGLDTQSFPIRYAALCQHHAIATGRGYSHGLTSRLHTLIQRGHQQLYRYKGNWLRHFLELAVQGFPQSVRRERGIVFLAASLFFGPFFIFLILCAFNPDITDLVVGSEQRRAMETMYDPSQRAYRPEGHEDSSAFQMFGFYIYNNVSIGFRMFAGGILFGIGSVFFAVFNGMVIGAVAGHLTGIGYGTTFWSFVPGHSAPELLGIVLCGAAGLMLGRALISPGQRTRRLALVEEAKAALPIVIGASLMIALAAVIEAYWSPRDLPLGIKISIGVAVWLIFLTYFIFAGRQRSTNA